MALNRKFIDDVRSSDAEARFAAWRAAGEQDPENIPELAKLANSTDAPVAKAAREAITTMVHSVGKEPSSPKRQAIITQLLSVPNGQTLRLLSLIGGDESVAPVAKLLKDPALREEAIFCIERIPGTVSEKTMIAAYAAAPDDFKPRILAALGHRRIAEAAPICVQAMKSPNKDIAVAAAKAFGRIGQKPAGAFAFPATTGLTTWQAIDTIDSQLRYADAQGNTPAAMQIYKTALARPEPHWQCAGIIGLAKLGTPEAAAAIFPLLKSSNRTVRLTAAKEWKRMTG